MVFAEGEEERVIRAAVAYRNAGYGTPLLIGREERVRETMGRLGIEANGGLEIHNARLSVHNKKYTDFLYGRLQRTRLSLPRLPAAGEPGPQRVRRVHDRHG